MPRVLVIRAQAQLDEYPHAGIDELHGAIVKRKDSRQAARDRIGVAGAMG